MPLSILHPIFGAFEDDFHEGKWTPVEAKASRELASAMSQVHFADEVTRERWLAGWHRNALGFERYEPASGSFHGKYADGKNKYGSFFRSKVSVLMMELRLETNDVGRAPWLEGPRYFCQLIEDMKGHDHFIEYSCLPGLLVTYQGIYRETSRKCFTDIHIGLSGPTASITGFIMHPDGTPQSQALTWTIRFDCDWRDYRQRDHIPRLIAALKKAATEIESVYSCLSEKTPSSEERPSYECQDPDHLDAKLHRRWLPYPTSYTSLDNQVHQLRFLDRLPTHGLLFLAQDTLSGETLCVKFVHQYCKDVHVLLADCNMSPALKGFEKLSGGWLMITMEYLDPDKWVYLLDLLELRIKNDARQSLLSKITRIVKKMHDAGYVHGDLRNINIFVEKDSSEVKLIDFDEAGLHGVAKYPRNWNHLTVSRPEGAEEGNLITFEHDLYMLDHIFDIEELSTGSRIR